jgi:hypothetical protein
MNAPRSTSTWHACRAGFIYGEAPCPRAPASRQIQTPKRERASLHRLRHIGGRGSTWQLPISYSIFAWTYAGAAQVETWRPSLPYVSGGPRLEAADLTSGSKILPCSPDICTCCRLDSSTVFYSITGRLAPCRRAAASRLLFPQPHLISLVESNAATKTSPTGCHEFGIPRYAAACAGAP